MQLMTFAPPAALAEDILFFWAATRPAVPNENVEELAIASGRSDIVLNLGDELFYRSGAGPWQSRPQTWFRGLFPRYYVVRPRGRVLLIGARFRMGRAGGLLDAPQSEFTASFVPLDDLYGDAARRLEDEARAAGDARASLARLSAFLGGVARRTPPDSTAMWMLREILASGGGARVNDLARKAGVSARTLERRFREAVGLTPKRVARVARLNAAMKRVERPGHPVLAEIAHECGYYDQAHMTEEFREMTGLTPSQYVRRPGGIHEAFLERAPLLDHEFRSSTVIAPSPARVAVSGPWR